MAPLYGRDHVSFILLEGQLGGVLLWRPNVDVAIVGATSQEAFGGVPLDLLYVILVTLPLDKRL